MKESNAKGEGKGVINEDWEVNPYRKNLIKNMREEGGNVRGKPWLVKALAQASASVSWRRSLLTFSQPPTKTFLSPYQTY